GSLSETAQGVCLPPRRAHLDIVGAGAVNASMDRRKPALVAVGRMDLPAPLHGGRKRQGLAAGAGAEIDHLLAGFGARAERRNLRALVLHLDKSLEKGRLRMDRRTLGIGGKSDAQPDRRPARGHRLEVGERLDGVLAAALERVDAQVERRAACKRRALGRALLAERA